MEGLGDYYGYISKALFSLNRKVRAEYMESIFIPHSDYLAHHGTKGQKWGQRRFQNYDGSLTAEGRRRYGVGDSRLSRREQKKAEKAKEKASKERAKANAQKKAEAQKLTEQKQKRMNYLRDHPEKIYKFRKDLTQDDVDQIMQKVKFDQSLKDIRKDEISRGMKKIDTIRNNTQTILNAYKTGKDVYNTIAEVNNAFIDMGYNKHGKKMLKFGEKNDTAVKELEKLLRTPDGVEQVYNNRERYSTDELNKAFKRRQIETLLENQVNANKKSAKQEQEKPKEEKISDKVQEVIRSGSPRDMMKIYNSANSKEQEAIQNAINQYQEVMELATKYKR